MATKTPAQIESELELEKEMNLLNQLAHSEGFVYWRDQYVKPTLDQLRTDLANDVKFSEVELRAKLKNYYWLDEFFNNMFEKIELAKQK